MNEREADAAPGTAAAGEEAATAQRLDPDAFRLRGDPPRVMRLSRKALAIAGAAAATAIGGALLWALQPAVPKAPRNLYTAERANRPDAVTDAVADYGNVPKLGPPLPGDLGRPIVSAQRDGDIVPVPPMGTAPADTRSPADTARERARQERGGARASRLFLGEGAPRASAADMGRGMVEAPALSAADGGVQSATASRRTFPEGGPGRPVESAERVRAPSSPNILQAGSVIPAALITGIRSDLPGQVTAQVTQNVYDSPTGRFLLIPQGARLVGEYESEVAAGQSRVLLAWDRLLLPGGRSIGLDRQPGADASGMAGLEDRVDNHWGRMLRAAFVSTLLGVGDELAGGGDSALLRALRYGAQDTAGQAGRRVVERELGVPPTLTIRPGAVLRVVVTRDLVLEPITGDRS